MDVLTFNPRTDQSWVNGIETDDVPDDVYYDSPAFFRTRETCSCGNEHWVLCGEVETHCPVCEQWRPGPNGQCFEDFTR